MVLPDFSALIQYFASDARRDVILKPRTDSLGTGVRFVSLRAGRAFDLNDHRHRDIRTRAERRHTAGSVLGTTFRTSPLQMATWVLEGVGYLTHSGV